MHDKRQEGLPGGSIGPEETSSQGTRWRAPDAGNEPDDVLLERTSLRSGPDGWYVVTAAAGTEGKPRGARAVSRCGPLPTWQRAERELMLMTKAKEDTLGFDLSDQQSLAVNNVMHEGLANRLFEATRKWTVAMGSQLESDALAGLFVPTPWQMNPRLIASDTPENRKLHELYSEVCDAAAILHQWSDE